MFTVHIEMAVSCLSSYSKKKMKMEACTGNKGF